MSAHLRRRRGFTVIEVTLFLGVTALMMLGIFIGISGAINRQTYESEVVSLIDFIQGEYSSLDNVRNNRANSTICNTGPAGPALTYNSATTTVVGSSECTIVGRLIVSGASGVLFFSQPVYSTVDLSTLAINVTERQYLTSMRLRTPPTTERNDQVTYESRGEVFVDGDTSNRHFSILIVKLPTNGMTRTYVLNSNVFDGGGGINGLLANVGTNQQPLRLCVNGATFGVARPSGVRIVPAAGSVAAVQRIAANEDTGNQGC